MGLEKFNPRNPADVNAIADLHQQYLSDSMVVGLGQPFLRDFYYRVLVEEGLFGAILCRVDGRVVGFISYTHRPLDFMSAGLRGHFLRVAWALFLGICRRPSVLKTIFHVGRLIGARREERRSTDHAGMGEAISMTVLPEYQNYVAPGGTTRLAPRLFLAAAQDLKALGMNRVLLNVQPANRAANLFYSAMGCSFEKIETAGFVIHRYIYRIKEG
jgi:hypothetical protein